MEIREDIPIDEREKHSSIAAEKKSKSAIRIMAEKTGEVIGDTAEKIKETSKDTSVSLITVLWLVAMAFGQQLNSIPSNFLSIWSYGQIISSCAWTFGLFLTSVFVALSVYNDPNKKINVPNLNETMIGRLIKDFKAKRND